MNETAFWQLIESSSSPDDCRGRASAIQATLEGMDVAEVASYCKHFDTCCNALYRWDLWAIAYLMMGGSSDDTFEYFRCWVISQGQAAYEAALADPAAFAMTLDPTVNGYWGCEDLLYAGGSAYKALTGKYGLPRTAPPIMSPAGEEWDEERVADLYPAVAARFGY